MSTQECQFSDVNSLSGKAAVLFKLRLNGGLITILIISYKKNQFALNERTQNEKTISDCCCIGFS